MTNTKVYLAIVKKLREMIALDGLKPGDKLPSERELSERLNAGRSSVREALRALELLGLIETRRGEGTFLRDFSSNQLVQLLGTFILQDDKARQDVYETKNFIEMDCLRLAMKRLDDKSIEKVDNWLRETEDFDDDTFFLQIIKLADNHLFFRIWLILKEYYNSIVLVPSATTREDYFQLWEALIKKDDLKIRRAYCKIRNLTFI